MQDAGTIHGKVVLITGGTSGIGKAAAAMLVALGAEVVVTGRDRERGERAVEEIKRDSGNENVSLMLADLAVQAEVRELAKQFKDRHDRLDVLVNNAGVINSRRVETGDGIEATLAVNHLAPFLLTKLLRDLLERNAPSRVVTVSSQAQRWGNVDLDDLQSLKGYRVFRVYGMTKLANIMFTFELAERLKDRGVTATCVHPGAVNTNLGMNNGGLLVRITHVLKPFFMRTPEQGADTLVWLAASPEVEGVTGQYFSGRKTIEARKEAYDPRARRELWEKSEELTNLRVTS